MLSNPGIMEQNTFKHTPVHTVSDIENSNFLFKFKGKTLDLSKKTHVMGIMNITPDSFSDGNQYKTVDEYLFRIEEMLDQGADIIDLGAESTRPGSKPVTADEELERLLPVLEQAIPRFETIFSVDTTKSLVAKQALERGVSIINDISGLSFEPDLGRHIANHDAGIILMHTPGRPDVMQELAKYDSILPEIISSLTNSITIAESFGINFENIIVDPGIGFGKTVEQNLEILRNLSELLKLRRPILIGTSRKSFIGKLLGNIDVHSRIEGSSATVAVSILNGASFVRVHDVNEMKKVVRMTDAIQGKN